MQKGFLISFEGAEGAGKTVQSKLLSDALVARGKQTILLREPGGTPVSEQIREVVLSTKNAGITDTTEVLLFQAARAQLYGEIVLPAIKTGKIVIMDRTRDSSLVYQGIVRGVGAEMIEQLNDISTSKTFPDLTFLLDVPVDVGLARVAKSRKLDRIESLSHDFHQKVRDTYKNIATKNDHNRWTMIDATQSMDVVAEKIWDVVAKRLSL